MRVISKIESFRDLTAYAFVAGIVLAYIVMCAPAVFQANGSYGELWTFSRDEPKHIRALYEFVHFRQVPDVKYVLFPAISSLILFSPFFVWQRLVNGSVSFSDLVTAWRFTQVFFGVVCIVFTYRTTRLVARISLALLACLFLPFMHEFFRWSTEIHPDIFQVGLISASMFFLCRFSLERRLRDYYVSSVLTGCAVAAKVYGVFIFPAAAVLMILPALIPFSRRKVFSGFFHATAYGGIMFVVAVLFSPNYIFHFRNAMDRVIYYNNTFSATTFEFYNALTPLKVINVCSFKLAGITYVLVYIVASLTILALCFRMLHRGRNVNATTRILCVVANTINLSVAAFILYYFFFLQDPFNVPGGVRYVMPFVIITLPVVFGFVDFIIGKSRPLGLAVCVLLIMAQTQRVMGKDELFGLAIRTFPNKMHQATFVKSTSKLSDESERALFSGSYIHKPDERTYEMREGLSSEQRARLCAIWCDRLDYNRPAGFYDLWSRYARQKEDNAGFKVRRWVKENVKPGQSILVEGYMSIFSPYSARKWCLVEDNFDLPGVDISYKSLVSG